jgi:hypothetical protein
MHDRFNSKLRTGTGRPYKSGVFIGFNLAEYILADHDSIECISHCYIRRIIYRQFHVALLLSEELHDFLVKQVFKIILNGYVCLRNISVFRSSHYG